MTGRNTEDHEDVMMARVKRIYIFISEFELIDFFSFSHSALKLASYADILSVPLAIFLPHLCWIEAKGTNN